MAARPLATLLYVAQNEEFEGDRSMSRERMRLDLPLPCSERWTTSSRAVRAETRAMSAGLAVCLAKPREGDRNLLQQLIPQDGV
jgi:hypothetical protein